MTSKTGRNDPCPCGSGKKYKQCCLLKADAEAIVQKAQDGAIERAIDWLMNRHRKVVATAIDAMLFDGLGNEERDELESLDADTRQSIQLNATEWLIAEGEILFKGQQRRVSDALLGPGGPLFTADQRRWIEQLSKRPLRLYDVAEVVPGRQMILCDALDPNTEPIFVQERSGSQESLIGTQIGVRLMEVDDHYELSGAAYPFSRLAGPTVIAAMREAEDEFCEQPDDLRGFLERESV